MSDTGACFVSPFPPALGAPKCQIPAAGIALQASLAAMARPGSGGGIDGTASRTNRHGRCRQPFLCVVRDPGKTETFLTRAGADVGWRSARRPRREGSHMHSVVSAVGRRLIIPCRPRFTRTQNRKTITCNAFLVTCNRFPVTCNGRGGNFWQTLAFLDYL